MAVDAQHSRGSKWKHGHWLFNIKPEPYSPLFVMPGVLPLIALNNLAQGEAIMTNGGGAQTTPPGAGAITA